MSDTPSFRLPLVVELARLRAGSNGNTLQQATEKVALQAAVHHSAIEEHYDYGNMNMLITRAIFDPLGANAAEVLATSYGCMDAGEIIPAKGEKSPEVLKTTAKFLESDLPTRFESIKRQVEDITQVERLQQAYKLGYWSQMCYLLTKRDFSLSNLAGSRLGGEWYERDFVEEENLTYITRFAYGKLPEESLQATTETAVAHGVELLPLVARDVRDSVQGSYQAGRTAFEKIHDRYSPLKQGRKI